jgi:uncharacterized OB-fold protein
MTDASKSMKIISCRACGYSQHASQDLYCINCWSENIEQRPISGRGILQSWVVYHKDYKLGFALPYAVGCVELAEGPRIRCYLDGDVRSAKYNQPIEITGVSGSLVEYLRHAAKPDTLTGLVVVDY